MPLYIRHSCCIKIPQFQPKLTAFIHLRHHYSTHFPIIQNPANPYFISLFTVPIKLFQLFILVLLLSRILLHEKKATPHSVTICFSLFSFISKREEMRNMFYDSFILSTHAFNFFSYTGKLSFHHSLQI